MHQEKSDTLFDKYGGVPTTIIMVRKLTERWLAHPMLRAYVVGMSQEALMAHQITSVTYLMGKPTKAYDALAMREAHHPLGITPHAYEELVATLRQVMLEMRFEAADSVAILATLDRQRHHLVAGVFDAPLYAGIDRRQRPRKES